MQLENRNIQTWKLKFEEKKKSLRSTLSFCVVVYADVVHVDLAGHNISNIFICIYICLIGSILAPEHKDKNSTHPFPFKNIYINISTKCLE